MNYASSESPEEYIRRITETWRASTPLGDQMDAALRPERDPRTGDPILFTPHWEYMAKVKAAVESVREIPTAIPDEEWLRRHRFTWLYSNQPGRRPLPARYDTGHDLAAEFVGTGEHADARRDALRETEADYLLAMAPAVTGPVMGKSVVVYGESARRYTPPLAITDLESGEIIRMESSLVAYPVPLHWTSLRVARMRARHARDCFWCGRIGDAGDATMPFALLVSAGALLRVFPACTGCRLKIDREYGDDGLSWLFLDDWDHATGYPAEQFR